MSGTPKDVVAIVPAAGSSVRFGSGQSKVFTAVAGVSILRRTVLALAAVPAIRKIIVLSRSEDVLLAGEDLAGIDGVGVREGGAARRDSVRIGLEYALSSCGLQATEYVLVHDGARCLISSALLERSLAEVRRAQAVTAAVPVVDTISFAEQKDGAACLLRTLDRSKLVAIQTPQVFRADLLLRAHSISHPASHAPAAPHPASYAEATDDAMLVIGFAAVHLVEGEATNIKVTRPIDVAIAEALLARESK